MGSGHTCLREVHADEMVPILEMRSPATVTGAAGAGRGLGLRGGCAVSGALLHVAANRGFGVGRLLVLSGHRA